MGAIGSIIINFGDAPAIETQASVEVIDQSLILYTSKVEAWMMPVDVTGDNGHNEDEHRVEDLRFTVPVSTVIAGVGFTVHGECMTGTTNGRFQVCWVWN